VVVLVDVGVVVVAELVVAVATGVELADAKVAALTDVLPPGWSFMRAMRAKATMPMVSDNPNFFMTIL
jgi:hypothetical protein